MDLARPRVALGRFPTPLHSDDAVERLLGVDRLLIKRDDLTGFGWSGNKVRAVEYLLGDMLAAGATNVVLAAGPTSNLAATMANAARRHGLAVDQYAYGTEPAEPPPALLVCRRLGTSVHFTGSDDRASMDRHAAERVRCLDLAGATPYLVPRGGASEIGALGFAAAAAELDEQLLHVSAEPGTVVLPVGSGGSISGLLVGQALLGVTWPVVGVAVSRPVLETVAVVRKLTERGASMLGLPQGDVPEPTIVDGRGAGFGRPEPAETELAIAIEAASGLLVDPVYNAKALRWLADAHVEGPVLYWHTGGSLGVAQRLIADVR
ncbi:MAG: pyridoxal-phosphate dependent enzyme [Acidimicrobiia bacterium]|nr:pyridoxal-phosphate dependent enzyme [Acidimicrobiia bacterium]